MFICPKESKIALRAGAAGHHAFPVTLQYDVTTTYDEIILWFIDIDYNIFFAGITPVVVINFDPDGIIAIV